MIRSIYYRQCVDKASETAAVSLREQLQSHTEMSTASRSEKAAATRLEHHTSFTFLATFEDLFYKCITS